jgi:hypothetical protein|tara:strand:+ start:34820 stop:35011 length:192 start_codon:yes stop_codon:yes gene_type:complete
VRGILLLLILILCSSCASKKKQSEKKDWAKIYQKELEIALKNEDDEAFMFFWPEYLKERAKKP